MLFEKNKTINIYNAIFGFTIIVYLLSEGCPYVFDWLDKLHIKHFLLMFSIFLGITNFKRNKAEKWSDNILKIILVNTLILYVISLLYQIWNGAFKFYAIEEVYYFLAPLVFVFLLFNRCKNDSIDIYINIFLYVGLFSFVVTRIQEGVFNLENLKSMFSLKSLFIDSVSAMNESDLSVFFMILTIYYAYKGKKGNMILSAIGTFLGYKRIAILFLIAFLIIYRIIKNKHKKVNTCIFILTILVFISAPFIVYYMCNDSFAMWFYNRFGIDFNEFTMTRFEIINTVIDADLNNYGLGTVTNFLEIRNHAGQTNMHNDILKIYMETGIIGTISFTLSYFIICRKSYFSYLIMLFIFIELFVAHFIGVGTVSFWILAYLTIFEINKDVYRKNEMNLINKKQEGNYEETI